MFVFGVVFDVRNLNVFGCMFGRVRCSVFGWCSVVFAVRAGCCVLFAVRVGSCMCSVRTGGEQSGESASVFGLGA